MAIAGLEVIETKSNGLQPASDGLQPTPFALSFNDKLDIANMMRQL